MCSLSGDGFGGWWFNDVLLSTSESLAFLVDNSLQIVDANSAVQVRQVNSVVAFEKGVRIECVPIV